MGTSRMRKKFLVGRIQDSSTESRRKMWRGEMSKKKERTERKSLVSRQTMSLKWFCSCLIFCHDHSVLYFKATGTEEIWKLILKWFQGKWIQYWVEPVRTLKTDVIFALHLYDAHTFTIQFDRWYALYASISEGKRWSHHYSIWNLKPFLVASTLVL